MRFRPTSRLPEFQSRLPARGSTPRTDSRTPPLVFQSPLPSGGARGPGTPPLARLAGFNPRSPRGERRDCGAGRPLTALFQSTLPSRGATRRTRRCHRRQAVSIHAPLAGSDQLRLAVEPVRHVSIHAPLAGSDDGSGDVERRSDGFNPRSPRGERHAVPGNVYDALVFQSTLPSRGATCIYSHAPICDGVSIHAPLAGSDLQPQLQRPLPGCFNPRSPRGERLCR